MMRAMSGAGGGAGARPSPYRLVFGGDGEGGIEAEAFPAIREEAAERGVDASDPERFIMLSATGSLIRELLPEDAEARAVLEAGQLIFQGYHFWRFGRCGYELDRPLAQRLFSRPDRVGEWELTPPHPAGYLALPRNLVWARIEAGAPAESVDGAFWTMIGREDPATPPYARLDALLVLGLRADRPGFSVVPVGAPVPGSPGHWADVRARPEASGADFANVLPGGELKGLHALVTEAEVLKLLSLVFRHVAARPLAVDETGLIRDAANGG
jgi:hypothetical protein